MFTGIINHVGHIFQKKDTNEGQSFWIHTKFSDLNLGESISVDGVCLTVAEINARDFRCDLSPETLRLTTLGERDVQDPVNLERALLATDRLGGHFVTGHVDGKCRLQHRGPAGDYLEMAFCDVPSELTRYLVKKGCICVNGVSLTINEVTPDGFSVMLIPHTLQCTNLYTLVPDDKVNLETDYLARFVLQNVPQGVAS